ncbi:MAG: hypothetical protein C3F13_14695 [Anaerolineales bacterium]|nr:hypothetical protein [Anaerolineae bacterium]PWB51106.1 MAG: hypothetical protein C3F13_14695 [Anaerolineales bacterium]
MDNIEAPSEPEKSPGDYPLEVKKRPRSVTLLVLIVLTITIISFLRFVLSIWSWSFIASRSIISPLYLALTGLVWFMAGAALIWGLWTAKSWAPRLMQAVGLTYALYYWLDQVFLKDHPVSGATSTMQVILPTNWPFAIGLTVVLLVFMEWTLNRARVKAYFAAQDLVTSHNEGQIDRESINN